MIRVFVYLGILFLVALGAAWIADRPGTIVIDWLDYEIEVGILTALTALLVVIAVALVALWALYSVIGAPRLISRYFSRRRRDKGYAALSRGIVAVGSGDERAAGKLASQAERLLPGDTAVMLLKAQSAQLSGDRAAAREAFEAMQDQSDARLLGLRGLFVEAQREGAGEAAFAFAQEARRLAPGLPWAAKAVFNYQCAAKDWDAALATLDANTQAKLIDKNAARRARAVLLTARALELETGEPDRARPLALEAHKLAPDLVPAAAVAGRLLSRSGELRKAMKTIETTWKHSPHPDLAEAYANVRAGDSALDRLKRITALTKFRAHHPECVLALAAAAIDARDWAAARSALEPLLRNAPTQRACVMMAEIEEGEHGDRGRMREWLSRAVHSARDPAWTADGIISQDWAATSPVSGRLDAFEWKVPVESLAAPTAPVIDEELLKPLGPPVAAIAEPVKELTAEPPLNAEAAGESALSKSEAAEAPADDTDQTEARPKGETSVITLKPREVKEEPDSPEADAQAPAVDMPEPDADKAQAAEREQPSRGGTGDSDKSKDGVADVAPTESASEPKAVEFPLPTMPDDPGTAEDSPEEQKKRFRLF